jgi:hypothetical protein
MHNTGEIYETFAVHSKGSHFLLDSAHNNSFLSQLLFMSFTFSFMEG